MSKRDKSQEDDDVFELLKHKIPKAELQAFAAVPASMLKENRLRPKKTPPPVQTIQDVFGSIPLSGQYQESSVPSRGSWGRSNYVPSSSVTAAATAFGGSRSFQSPRTTDQLDPAGAEVPSDRDLTAGDSQRDPVPSPPVPMGLTPMPRIPQAMANSTGQTSVSQLDLPTAFALIGNSSHTFQGTRVAASNIGRNTIPEDARVLRPGQ